MMINSSSPFAYASVNTSTSSNSMANGPQGAGGPQGGKPPKGPNLDTDGDGSWSQTEIEEFASYASEEFGVTLDAEEIISTYDTDGDGSISISERDALAQDNALQLPSPEELQGMMPGSGLSSEDDENSYFAQGMSMGPMSMCIDAYTMSQSYSDESLETLFETTA